MLKDLPVCNNKFILWFLFGLKYTYQQWQQYTAERFLHFETYSGLMTPYCRLPNLQKNHNIINQRVFLSACCCYASKIIFLMSI